MALGCSRNMTVACLITCLFSAVIFSVWVTAMHQQWGNHNNVIIKSEQFASPKLEFVAVLFRHGNRAPEFKYKTDPYVNAFPEGKGELTKKGKQNMYKKGQFFRQMYNDHISELYLDSEILMRTTNIRRTHMSAAMVLAGMYPPKTYQKWSDSETVWQPIPIYNDSPDHGTLFNEKGKCPSFDLIAHNLIQSINNNNENETATLMQYLSEKSGQPITNNNLIFLYDVIVCQMADGLQPPEWILEFIGRIKSINEENIKIIFENTTLQNLVIGPLLREVVSNIELRSNISNHNTTRKMYLYAGHDVSIGMTMGFLNNYISMPGFGSSVHFHLYLSEKIGYTIKVFYYDQWDNEIGEEVLIPTCENPCKMQDFINLVKDKTSKEWEEECQKVEN